MLKRAFLPLVGSVLALPSLACMTLDDPTDAKLTTIATLSSDSTSLPADGVSRTTVTLTLADDTPLGTQFTISTNAGALTGAGKGVSQEIQFNAGARVVPFTLISGTSTGFATVNAKTDKSIASVMISLGPALPSLLQLAPDVQSAKADGRDAIHVTAHLFRPQGSGTVSQGTPVLFTVTQIGGGSVPQASGTEMTDSAGAALHTITMLNAGQYKIVGSSGSDSALVKDSIIVQFTPP